MDAWLDGSLKLVRLPPPYGNTRWQLYDLAVDPGETNDIADEKPELVKRYAANWETYARENEVVHPNTPVAYGKPVAPGKY